MATSNTRRNADARGDDLYTTPPWAIRALLSREKFSGNIVDAGCGTGNIVNVLVDQGYDRDDITTIDKYDQGYKDLDVLLDYADFDPYENVDNVISNPPFLLFTPFVLKSLKLATKKVAIFARINSLETEKRYKAIHRDNPPSKIYSFVNRVKCAKGGEDGKNDGSVMYCWLVWDFSYGSGATTFEWISDEKGNMSLSKPNEIVSFSGGRTSGNLVDEMIIKQQKGDINLEVIFMDTGAEHPKTYDFIRNINNHYGIKITCLKAVVNTKWNVGATYEEVDINDLKWDLNLFKSLMEKYGNFTVNKPFCSERVKSRIFKKYCDKKYGRNNYNTWLGIRIDEPKRLPDPSLDTVHHNTKSKIKYLAYISDKTKEDIIDWWKNMPFDLDLPEHLGNCVFCVKKGVIKIALAARHEPELWDDWANAVTDTNVRLTKTDKFGVGHVYRKWMNPTQLIASFSGSTTKELEKRVNIKSQDEPDSECSESCEVNPESGDDEKGDM